MLTIALVVQVISLTRKLPLLLACCCLGFLMCLTDAELLMVFGVVDVCLFQGVIVLIAYFSSGSGRFETLPESVFHLFN